MRLLLLLTLLISAFASATRAGVSASLATPRGDDCPASSHVAGVLADIRASKAAILAHGGENGAPLNPADCVFVTYWDFDGTVLKGDCSEGLVEDGKAVYMGLYEACVRAGFASRYTRDDAGVKLAWAHYRQMDEDIGSWLAYPYLAQCLRGAEADAVYAMASKHFREKLRAHVFAESEAMMTGLRESGIEVRVVSASADVLVRAVTSNLPYVNSGVGIRTEIENGKLTERIVYPVTYADGKTAEIRRQLAEQARTQPGKRVFVLAGFGNSYGTDGPFLKHIATQALPGGAKPVALMINGGAPKLGYAGVFRCVEQSRVTGAAK